MSSPKHRPLVAGAALALAVGVSTSALAFAQERNGAGSPKPKVSSASHFAEFNGSLADLPKLKATKGKRRNPRDAFGGRLERQAGDSREGADQADPLRSKSGAEEGDHPTPAPGVSFPGMTQAETGFRPPDTNGDVGPDHYFQAVNVAFEIFDKTGTSLAGPTPINQLWVAAGAGGLCQANNRGDPVVLYDDFADRWLITQFAFPTDAMGNRTAPYAQCAAVSQTSDPVSGGWFLYEFPAEDSTAGDLTTLFPDYPKWGVWSDGYYFSTNEIGGGSGVYAVDRADMLAGAANPEQIYFTQAGEEFFLPADADGPTPPPAGDPAPFAEVDETGSQLQVYEFDADFTTPASSTFTLADTIPVTAFEDDLCDDTAGTEQNNCIPQPGVVIDHWLEPLNRERLMMGLKYRNFGTHETLVANHTVDVNGADLAGVRWYELRHPGGSWALQQEGTHSPDGTSRWLGSIAMDTVGNIGLAYNVSSTTVFPGIRYTHQTVGDAAGTMDTEQTLANGAGSQTCTDNIDTDMDMVNDACRNRWGDYSSISVDPSDLCTFWVTNEYINVGGAWETQIGNFDLCEEATISAAPNPMDFGIEDVGSIGPTQTLTVTNVGDANLDISNVSKHGAFPGDFLVVDDNCEGQTVAPSGTCDVDLRFAPSGGGPRSASLRLTSNATNDPYDVPLSGVGDAPAPPSGFCRGLPVTVGGATPGDDIILGTDGDDVIRGDTGSDVIRGLGGNDTICGEDGDDRLSGGSAADFLRGDAGDDSLRGSPGGDDLRGGIGDDLINGGRGPDALRGQVGADDLRGSAGADMLVGGPWRDRCNGGASKLDTAAGCERQYLIP